MIVKCGRKDGQKVLSYIGSDYSRCLYLYLNLQKYGMDSDIIEVYLQEEGKLVTAVMLKYYSCLHVYSRDGFFKADEIGSFFVDNGFMMLYSTAETGSRLFSALPDSMSKDATISKGWVARIKNVDREPKGLSIPAQDDDFVQIVKLIYEDEDIGRSYNYDDLAKQLVERNKEGYARNLVIKNDGLVIAHICTNAEFGEVSVIAELLVREEYRGRGYASEIMRSICSDLLSEEKDVYSFYYSEESRRLHKHIGFYEVCEWSKIVINS